jgi:polar amino acid transport system permease protein
MLTHNPSIVASSQSGSASHIKITEPANAGRWIGLSAIALFTAWIVFQIVVNPGFQWDVVAQYFFAPSVLRGVLSTLQLTVLVMIIGTVLGIVIGVMQLSNDPQLRYCGKAFVWFFRGVPPLVQLIFWYNLATLFPEVSLGIPFDGPKLWSVSATIAISPFTAAMLGLGLVEAAYMAEIVRAGLLSVDPGQSEASRAVGHRPAQTFFVIVLPQAMKAIIPPTGNQVIGALKFTSLASIVSLGELMHSVETIYSRTFETIPMLIVASLWYLILVSLLTVMQYFIERHFSKGWRAEAIKSTEQLQ